MSRYQRYLQGLSIDPEFGSLLIVNVICRIGGDTSKSNASVLLTRLPNKKFSTENTSLTLEGLFLEKLIDALKRHQANPYPLAPKRKAAYAALLKVLSTLEYCRCFHRQEVARVTREKMRDKLCVQLPKYITL